MLSQNLYAIEQDELFNRSIPYIEWDQDHWVDEATGKRVKLPCFLPDGTSCDSPSYEKDRAEDRLILDGERGLTRATANDHPISSFDPDHDNPVVRVGSKLGRKP